MARASKDKHSPQDIYGAYRLINRIATSKKCEVWQAEHARGRRPHAVKIMLPMFRNDREAIGYLKREYAISSPLRHESVIRVDEFGEDDGLAFLVMEYFPSLNLKQWIREAPPNAHELIPDIIKQAAASLGYLHAEGIIHRDVKPDNFLINEQGKVKLIDFTLARKMRGWLGRLLEGSSQAQGTLSYMAPEQIRNKPQDQRADLYSLGCVIYELLCGKPPYTGANPQELLRKHLNAPIPALKTNETKVSGPFARIVKQLLAKDPSDRQESIDDVLRHVEAVEVFE